MHINILVFENKTKHMHISVYSICLCLHWKATFSPSINVPFNLKNKEKVFHFFFFHNANATCLKIIYLLYFLHTKLFYTSQSPCFSFYVVSLSLNFFISFLIYTLYSLYALKLSKMNVKKKTGK